VSIRISLGKLAVHLLRPGFVGVFVSFPYLIHRIPFYQLFNPGIIDDLFCLLSEKGFYGMSFTLALFGAIAVQKNIRDSHADNLPGDKKAEGPEQIS